MARRSPANERYGKHTAPSGKTRKSAAAAKPKRASATTPAKSSKSSKSSKSGKPAAKKREPMVYNPDTPEYKKWRRIWWGCLAVAMVSTGVSFFVMKAGPQYQTFGSVLLGLGYAAIAAALYLDFTKLRKMRAEWVNSGKAVEAGKAAEKAQEEKAAAKAAEKTSDEKGS